MNDSPENKFRRFFCVTALICMLCLGISGCTLVTDFDSPDQKIRISEQTGDEAEIAFNGGNGVLSLMFDDALSVDVMAGFSELVGQELELTLVDESQKVSYDLFGQEKSPVAQEGDFSISFSEDKRTVHITFVNLEDGTPAILSNHQYTVLIQVTNNPFFHDENLSLAVVFE